MKKLRKFSIAKKRHDISGMGKRTGLAHTVRLAERPFTKWELLAVTSQGPCGKPVNGPCGIVHTRSNQGCPCGDKHKIVKMIKANGAKGNRK